MIVPVNLMVRGTLGANDIKTFYIHTETPDDAHRFFTDIVKHKDTLGHMPVPGIYTTVNSKTLLCTGCLPVDKPLLTVELYTKWYRMYLIHPNGTSEEHIPSDYEVRFKDDTFNPTDIQKYAYTHNYHIDPLALEMLIGRWEQETLENYFVEEPEDW